MAAGSLTSTFVSVILPVFNGGRWLIQCIESVLAQDFTDFELLIIDDGSTDNSLSIIKKFSSIDSRIRYLVQENMGLAFTLNRGINASAGIWIARIDSDDLWAPGKLSAQYTCLRDNPQVVCIGSGFFTIDTYAMPLGTTKPPCGHEDILSKLLTSRTCFPHSSALFRKDIALRLEGYRACMYRAQDTDFWLRLSELGCLAVIPYPLVSIRVHGSQLSSGSGADDQLLFGWLAVVSYYLRLGGYPDPLDTTTSVSSKYQGFIHEGLTRAGFFKVRHMKLQFKNCIRSGSFGHLINCFKLFLSEFLSSPSLFFFLVTEAKKNRQLALQLATEWSRQV